MIPDDIDGYAEINAATAIPASGGEHAFTRWGHEELLERDAVRPRARPCGDHRRSAISARRRTSAVRSARSRARSPAGGCTSRGVPNGRATRS
nr:hypothetical protein [Halococcus agarilyticus]